MSASERWQLNQDWVAHLERELELLNRELTDPNHGVDDMLSLQAAIRNVEQKLKEGKAILSEEAQS